MELKEDIVDIIIPFFPSEQGQLNLEIFKQSLQTVDPGFPYRLIVAEGEKPAIQNMNEGLLKSNTRYFLKCDDDIIFIHPNWLKTAVEIIKKEPKCGAVGFRIEDINGKVINAGRIIKETGDPKTPLISINILDIKNGSEFKREKRDHIAGCCMLVDRLVAGFFPEKLYPGKLNCDDVDYMMTINANGFMNYYLGDIPVIHNEKTKEEKTKLYNLTEKDELNHEIFQNRWKLAAVNITIKKDD